MSSPAFPAPEAADKLEAVAALLTAAAPAFRSGSVLPVADHHRLIDGLQDAVAVAKQPRDELKDLMMSFVEVTALRLLVKWDVFAHIPAVGTISYGELAAKVGGETNLITRFCWALVSTGTLRQEGTDGVAHTARSLPYASVNPLRAMMLVGFDEYLPSFLHLPRYFDEYGLKEPTGPRRSARAFAEGTPELTVNEITYRHPERVANMTLAMSAMENMYPNSGVYDFGWVAAQATESPDRTLVVDVGGAKGHILQAICRDTPGLSLARCVLQDVPAVIDIVRSTSTQDDALADLEMMGMDFHEGQPVKGALVYMIRRCLHDFNDDQCVQILRHLNEAMAADSRLLIGETVLSNPPSRATAMVDLLLCTIGGKERTLDSFRAVVQRAGLEISSVHRAPQVPEFAMIECRKVPAA